MSRLTTRFPPFAYRDGRPISIWLWSLDITYDTTNQFEWSIFYTLLHKQTHHMKSERDYRIIWNNNRILNASSHTKGLDEGKNRERDTHISNRKENFLSEKMFKINSTETKRLQKIISMWHSTVTALLIYMHLKTT